MPTPLPTPPPTPAGIRHLLKLGRSASTKSKIIEEGDPHVASQTGERLVLGKLPPPLLTSPATLTNFYVGSDNKNENGGMSRYGCRVTRWHAGADRAGGGDGVSERSEAGRSESADYAICVVCEQFAEFLRTLHGPSECSICEDLFREMFWCVLYSVVPSRTALAWIGSNSASFLMVDSTLL